MEDVKDTLWKWFVQLSALLGLCCSVYVAYSFASSLLSLPRTPPDGSDLPPDVLRMMRAWMIAAGLLLGPMLGTVWFRMLLLRKWAAWVICALGAWVTLTSMAFMPRLVQASHLAPGQGSDELGGFVWRAGAMAYVVLLGYALILKPSIWRNEL